ncbi:tyrosine-type recombinase/integrase [Aquipuribacter sp. MA13-6]|uniref:tyrosine-type recombinase/integrase n=1 Tax=unclassified Aquipuribacter TaxID=2635084 RepID=UPI003EE9D780
MTALDRHRGRQQQAFERAGLAWITDAFVFATATGTAPDAADVRRGFRVVVEKAGLDPGAWTPRELRHSFVSLLSDGGMTIEQVAELLGRRGSRVTEAV